MSSKEVDNPINFLSSQTFEYGWNDTWLVVFIASKGKKPRAAGTIWAAFLFAKTGTHFVPVTQLRPQSLPVVDYRSET